MKTLNTTLLVSLILLVQVSCDRPRDRRTVGDPRNTENRTPINDDSSSIPNTPTTTPQQEESGNNVSETTPSGVSNLPQQIQHCRWPGAGGFSHSHPHVGQYTLCQNQSDDTDIYVQVQSPITDASLCLIPVHSSSGRAVFIGEPRCIEIRDSSNIYRINMLKNRPNFSHFRVNGIMMMKDLPHFYPLPFNVTMLSVDAYLNCAHQLDTTGNPAFCQAFDSVGQYVFHQF